jgi:hypothetical protein
LIVTFASWRRAQGCRENWIVCGGNGSIVERNTFLYLSGKDKLTGEVNGYKIQVEEAGKGLQ